MKTCVFAGTFDPFTKGHQFVVDKCLEIFDKVVIAVGKNVDKTPLFTDDERVNAIKRVYKDENRVEVKLFSGMLTDFMKENDIKVTVRGLRNQDDYKYESTMAQYNKDMYDEVVTLYIPTPLELSHVSSSAIRNIISSKGDFKEYLPKESCQYLIECLKNKN